MSLNINDQFHIISTLVKTIYDNTEYAGSGFFYHVYGDKNPENPQWTKIEHSCLVTNRHILLPRVKNNEKIPEKLIFHLWRIEANKVNWFPVELDQDEIIKKTKLHSDPEVDIAVIELGSILQDIITKEPTIGEGPYKSSIITPISMSMEKFPGNNKINVEVSDDVLIIGYPRGVYDEHNIFPIVKSGIIASKWGAYFNGKPYFLIDAKLFPGSSGSIVLSKPRDIIIDNGNVYTAKEKQYSFLGIFSAEPLKNYPKKKDGKITYEKLAFDTGIVWYGNLIEEIIKNGIAIR